MITERIQVKVSSKGEKDVIAYIADFEHPRWRSLTQRTAIARAALRIAYAHDRIGPDVGWFIRRHNELSAPLSFVAVPAGVLKVDVNLDQADQQRADALARKEAPSRPAVVRACLHFLANIAEELKKGGELVAGAPGGPKVAVDLKALANDEPLATRLMYPMQAELPERRTQPVKRAVESRPIDELFAIIWLTTSFNRWLTTHVDDLTHRAQRTLRRDTPLPEQADKTLVPDRETFEVWQAQLDLLRLFREFCRTEWLVFGADEGSTLKHEFPLHQLLPSGWLQREDLPVLARTGAKAVWHFLRNRFRSLRSWQAAREYANPLDSPRPQRVITYWRNWTRSRSTSDGCREMAPPLEWTAVLHHRLRRKGGDPALVAHDLQKLILAALGANNSRDIDELAEACARFNAKFHAHPVIAGDDAFEGNETLLSFEDTLDVFRGTTAAVRRADVRSPEERDNFAKLMYLAMCVARVIKPVYRWRPKALESDRQPLVAPDEVDVLVRSIAYADFSELRARIFGAQTTIDGLHWILHGGIVPRANRGRAWADL